MSIDKLTVGDVVNFWAWAIFYDSAGKAKVAPVTRRRAEVERLVTYNLKVEAEAALFEVEKMALEYGGPF